MYAVINPLNKQQEGKQAPQTRQQQEGKQPPIYFGYDPPKRRAGKQSQKN